MGSNHQNTLELIEAFNEFSFSGIDLFLEKHDLAVLRDRLLVSFIGELESIPVLKEFWFEYLDGSPKKLVEFYERVNERKRAVHYENLIILFLISFLAEVLAGLVVVEYSRNHDRIVETIKKMRLKSRKKIEAVIKRVSDKYGVFLEYLFKVYILKDSMKTQVKLSYAKFQHLRERIRNTTIQRGRIRAELPEDFMHFEETFLRKHSLPPLDENFAQKLANELLSLSVVSRRKPKKKGLVSVTTEAPLTVAFSVLRSHLNKKLEGLVGNQGYAVGRAKIVLEEADCDKVEKGDIVVLVGVRPYVVGALRLAGGVLADKDGLTGHTAIVGRELGLPTIVKTKNGTKVLRDGMNILVDAINGFVYEILG